jgi:dolichol-phosphate mannosyltransferase
LDAASGDVVFLIDGDLQDDPAKLPRFIDEYMRGADVVYATRTQRPESIWLRAAYALHYRLLALVSDTPIPVDAGDFSLLSRKAVDLIKALPERQRYLRGLRAWVGLKQAAIPIERQERLPGAASTTIWDLVGLSLSGLFAFTIIPLRVATVVGAATVFAGLGYGVYVLVDRLTGATADLPSRPVADHLRRDDPPRPG